MIQKRPAGSRHDLRRARSLARAASTIRDLPSLTRYGPGVLGAGVVLDVVAHVGPLGAPAMAAGAHLVVLGGMVLAVAGAIAFGIRSRRRPERGGWT